MVQRRDSITIQEHLSPIPSGHWIQELAALRRYSGRCLDVSGVPNRMPAIVGGRDSCSPFEMFR